MSQYTTGEAAKLCGVTVRTVQYYDQRGILTPGELTEGGRRLYSEDDLKRLKVICFLRELGFSIDSIGRLLAEEDPGSVVDILLSQQEKVLEDELEERREKLSKLSDLRKSLKRTSLVSVESINDIAHTVENKKKLFRLRRNLILFGIPMGLLQWGSVILWVLTGQWWLFAVWAALVVPYAIFISRYYYKNVAYICPQCHEVFRPTFKEMFFASHTPRTRKLTCAKCGHRGFCVETWGGD